MAISLQAKGGSCGSVDVNTAWNHRSESPASFYLPMWMYENWRQTIGNSSSDRLSISAVSIAFNPREMNVTDMAPTKRIFVSIRRIRTSRDEVESAHAVEVRSAIQRDELSRSARSAVHGLVAIAVYRQKRHFGTHPVTSFDSDHRAPVDQHGVFSSSTTSPIYNHNHDLLVQIISDLPGYAKTPYEEPLDQDEFRDQVAYATQSLSTEGMALNNAGIVVESANSLRQGDRDEDELDDEDGDIDIDLELEPSQRR
ncbi:hypothetical protein F5146DRAFT_1001280 [Armillaria mellea]|nr:hypothetical protein F5146DRAFT_1001280 [Armillaria mellea]